MSQQDVSSSSGCSSACECVCSWEFVCRVYRRGVERCFICNTVRPWCLGMNDGGGEESGKGVEEEEKERRWGVTSLCHHLSPVVFHLALTLCSAVLVEAQACFVCMCQGRCPLLSTCSMCMCLLYECVCTGSDTRTTPEHSSGLTGITPRSHAERGTGRVKEKVWKGRV